MAAVDPRQIYLRMMAEIGVRITATQLFLDQYNLGRGEPYLESAILQLRKILENIALAAIAPIKDEYEKFRAEAERPADYRKDYNGHKILLLLEKINPDFYPIPLAEAVQVGDNQFLFENKTVGYLSKKKFESLYDRLGKYLHSDNPWGNKKHFEALAKDIPQAIEEIKGLLERHRVIVRKDGFEGVWVYEQMPGTPARILIAHASGPFVVDANGGLSSR